MKLIFEENTNKNVLNALLHNIYEIISIYLII
jgi:hypothetical protein